ncbi:uncharacterized protein BDR25DRAFT_297660 [Lindgomyces ingoldianus]|uniref:Uncharacterized protein n=1 Tax=Lindgomyces ingoldianus TaxID=673940 RepID=A0ACB6Q9C9_9PLEO|nr:uncharacterized protein BDR25DRAFT_297660 [Lindgomyces ingoldianus]KAF2463578.1 hypothetical protein BDR25DRAFT_297660 [Lindgomyces ingoldianus]
MSRHDKRMKSCDQCKARKVRCSGREHREATSCLNCARRNEACHFSLLRKPQRLKYRADVPATTPAVHLPSLSDDTHQTLEANDAPAISEATQYDGLQELHLDRLLAGSCLGSARQAQCESLQTLGVFGSEYSLTFFSEARLASLGLRLGHDRISKIRAQMAAIITQRMRTVERVPAPACDNDRCRVFGASDTFITTCIRAYFEHVHPIYPFLDRSQVESIASGPQLQEKLAIDKAWSALFFGILALGSQYNDGGSFQPTNNVAWKFFSTALAIFLDLLITKASLVSVQAITTLAIFASNVSCMQFEYALVAEGVKKAQMLGYNRLSTPGNDARNRTFWVLFCLEKTMTFTIAKSSSIIDSDISSALPVQEDQAVGHEEFDSFLTLIRLSRLFSRIYASLHSVSIRGRPRDYFKSTIDRLRDELECWRMSIPPPFRPGQGFRNHHHFQTAQMVNIYIRFHYGYHNTMLHLNRAALHLRHPDTDLSKTVSDIMRTTRSILEMTKCIDVQPYTPLWILAAVPLTALFVLFDLVIDNPSHSDTAANLALLDIGSGHFSRIEYASQGTLPGSILSEFAHIARCYVREKTQPQSDSITPGISALVSPTTALAPTGPDQVSKVVTQVGLPTNDPIQPNAANWPLQADAEVLAGTDILDLFGSYLPEWNEEWILGAPATTLAS